MRLRKRVINSIFLVSNKVWAISPYFSEEGLSYPVYMAQKHMSSKSFIVINLVLSDFADEQGV